MKWEKAKFGSLFSTPTRNGVYKNKEAHGEGVKIVNMGEIFGYDFIGNQEMQRIMMSENEMKVSGLQENDLLFARRSLVESGAGKASIVLGLSEPTTFESSIIRVRLNSENCFPLFYFYWLRSHAGRTAIGALVTGTNVKGIRGSALKDIDVDYPDIDTQRRIADVLMTYDNLIENNQKQIKLLEEAAQRLYKEWFVDMRFPGHENVKIVDGVPEGWKKGTIISFFTTVLGGTPSREKKEYWGGNIPWINSGEVNKLRIIKESEFISELGLKKSATKLMPVHTTVLAITGATLGQVSYTEIETCANQSVVGIYDQQKVYSEYIYLAVSNEIKSIISKATGGAQQHINKDIVNNFEIILPSKDVNDQFKTVISPLFTKITECYFSIEKLTEARDRLLPKLMSGELEV